MARIRALRIDELPIEKLKERATAARRILRGARALAGTVGGLHAIDHALDRAERLLPGLMDRSSSVPLLTVRRLAPADRRALGAALRAGEAPPPEIARALRGVSREDALEALERVAIYESLAADVMALLSAIERGHPLPLSSCS